MVVEGKSVKRMRMLQTAHRRASPLTLMFTLVFLVTCSRSDSTTDVRIVNELSSPVHVVIGSDLTQLLPANSSTTVRNYYVGGAGQRFDVYDSKMQRIGVISLTMDQVAEAYSRDVFILHVNNDNVKRPTQLQPKLKFN